MLFVLPAALFVVSMVVFPLLFGLWIAFSDWNLSVATGRSFNGFANIEQMLARPLLLERARATWSGTCSPSSSSTPSPSASRCCSPPRSRPQVLARRLPDAADAVAGRGLVDGRQVDARAALRPGRPPRAPPRLGQPVLLRLARDRAGDDHGPRRLDLHPVHDDHAPRRPPEPRPRGDRGRPRRRRQPLAAVLGGHLPADAAGQRDGHRHPHHLQAQARRHHHHRHLRRARRRDRTR